MSRFRFRFTSAVFSALTLFSVVFAQELTDLSSLENAIAEVKPDNGSNTSAEIAAESATEPASTEPTAPAVECDVSKNPYNLPCELMPLWEKMTIKQKAAQMVMVYMTPADFMIKNEFGGYLVMKNHLKKLDNFQENLKTVNSTMEIPPIVAVDQEGGLVNRVSAINPKWERTPSAKSMRKMTNEKVENIGRKIGAAMKEVGINVNLAPVLDPSKDSRGKNSFMEESDRSWGPDTTNANKVRSFVEGMRQSGIACVSKHFPGYDSWTNSDHQIAISATPKAKIQKNVEFFRALSNDIPITMMSSVRFVRISNRPAVFEPKIVQMARDMSPETVILTDDLWGVSLRAWVSGTERVKGKNYPAKDFKKLVLTALTAGNDMFMITFPRKAVDMVNILTNLSKQNSKYKQRIEESAARILKMKYKAGLL